MSIGPIVAIGLVVFGSCLGYVVLARRIEALAKRLDLVRRPPVSVPSTKKGQARRPIAVAELLDRQARQQHPTSTPDPDRGPRISSRVTPPTQHYTSVPSRQPAGTGEPRPWFQPATPSQHGQAT
jgi:hypothetical protein